MNKMDLIDHVASAAALPKAQAGAALDAMIEGIAKALQQGEDVRLVGFGTFTVKDRAATTGRNPSTGKEIQIAASKNARFKPSGGLKDALNGK